MERHLRSLCKNLRDFLIAKSTCVTSGFMLNAAITMSVRTAVAKAGEYSYSTPVVHDAMDGADEVAHGDQFDVPAKAAVCHFVFILFLFVLVLFASAFGSRAVLGVQWIPHRMRTIYAQGCGFIPAWQWKDVISALMIACLAPAAEHPSPYLVAGVVLSIAFFTAIVQVLLENWVAVVDETTLAFQVFHNLKTSLGLGMGFAVNVLLYAILRSQSLTHSQQASVVVSYVFCLTVSVACIQYKFRPMLDSKKELWHPLPHKACVFLLLALNFVVGFAWKELIDLTVDAFTGPGLWWRLLASTLTTFVLSSVVIGITLIAEPADGTPSSISGKHLLDGRIPSIPGIEDLCILASAMNVGWTWAAFAMACMRWVETERNDGHALGVGQVWLFTVLVVMVASLVAVMLEYLIDRVEPKSPEEQPLVK